jgi:phosphoglycerol transferase MdoB-like AlkP superfamily enzyme
MNEYYRLAIVCILVFIINLPFGYWRGGVKKFSWQWFLAVHIPVPFVIALRFAFELGFQFYTYPFMIAAFFLGQFVGAKYRISKK